jgi:lysophospholipase L1-like esterase
MKTPSPCPVRGVRLAAACVLSGLSVLLTPAILAQGAPAAAATPAPSPALAPATTGTLAGFSLAQQAAAAGMMISALDLNSAVAAARAALTRAVFAEPFDRAVLNTRAEELKAAEVALANARLAALARLQASPDRLTPAQVDYLGQQVAAGRGGGGIVPRHNGFMADKAAVVAQGGPQFVLIGDSITDFWRRTDSQVILQKYFGRYRPYNIGISGIRTVDVRMQVALGLLDGLAPKVAMIMIGTNDLAARGTVEATAESIQGVVGDVRKKLPGAKILLLGIFPRGNLATDPYREQIRQVNAIIAKLDDGKQVRYLDFGEKFLDPDGTLPATIMPDFLHPNAAGYQIWADAVSGTIEEMMK